jgi:hypothetical protein
VQIQGKLPLRVVNGSFVDQLCWYSDQQNLPVEADSLFWTLHWQGLACLWGF